ncbi:MAG: sodium:proton antiporter [Chloroflexota bacterium]
MKRVATFSLLLITGLIGAPLLPELTGDYFPTAEKAITSLTLIGLGFIMIHVGYEFEIDKSDIRSYGWDYVVAMTAAAFPWVFVTFYFVFAMLPPSAWNSWNAWTELLLAGRFAAPTSAGVLFSMLAAAGLSATWLFRKARVLAIFDDLDTILLMIPLKMLIVGLAWQLGVIVLIMVTMLWLAWKYLHRWAIPTNWPWVLIYSVGIVVVSELISIGASAIDDEVPIHIEVLLPAFVLGCMMKRPADADPHRDDAIPGHQEGPEDPREQKVAILISAAFMLLVGLSMATVFASPEVRTAPTTVTAQQPVPDWSVMAWHIFAVTILSNLGKMFPALCYRREAGWKERLALAIGMWPRGEVGAGVLVVSISYGIGGPVVTVAALTLALNLVLTGGFIWLVQKLLAQNSPGTQRLLDRTD